MFKQVAGKFYLCCPVFFFSNLFGILTKYFGVPNLCKSCIIRGYGASAIFKGTIRSFKLLGNLCNALKFN